MAHAAIRFLADDSSGGGVTIYVGIAAVITAATGLVGAVAALLRVLRAPSKRDDQDRED